ncbi:uncharacterized protein LOC108594760 [Drosophila busckii]|uniref:uncharacterized protein LOC108594760 n=1 Tax=Drosophila busckii TaxID=30019 RepID=UPI001432CD24|nr:uncharacterized protein LOC108594760 [Drosophila busckii]
MTHCIWLLSMLALVNARSLQGPRAYAHAYAHQPLPYYGHPYGYPAPAPYGFAYQPRPFVYNPPGTYFDSAYGVRKPLPGGGNPVAVDYNNRCSRNYVGIKPHPDQQQYYYVCRPNCVIFSKCPNQEQFNSSSGHCMQRVYPNHQLACNKPGRFPYPYDCKVYYRCDEQRNLHIYRCSPRHIFNPQTQTCIPGDDCPATEISNGGSYIPENCELKFPECTKEGNFRSPTDCGLYYTCKLQPSGNYLQTRFKCPPNESYDLKQNKCQPMHNVDCRAYLQLSDLPYAPMTPFYPYPPQHGNPEIGFDGDYDAVPEEQEQEQQLQPAAAKSNIEIRPNIVILPTTTPTTTTSTTTVKYPAYPSYPSYPYYPYGSYDTPKSESQIKPDATISSRVIPEAQTARLTTPTTTSRPTTPTTTAPTLYKTSSAAAAATHQEILTVNKKPWLLQAQNQTLHLTPIVTSSSPVINANRSLLAYNSTEYATEKVPELILNVYEPIDVKVVFCPRNCDEDHDHQYDPDDSNKYNCSNYSGNCKRPKAHHAVDVSFKPVKLSDTAGFQMIA